MVFALPFQPILLRLGLRPLILSLSNVTLIVLLSPDWIVTLGDTFIQLTDDLSDIESGSVLVFNTTISGPFIKFIFLFLCSGF